MRNIESDRALDLMMALLNLSPRRLARVARLTMGYGDDAYWREAFRTTEVAMVTLVTRGNLGARRALVRAILTEHAPDMSTTPKD
jgi:hypothetical protein